MDEVHRLSVGARLGVRIGERAQYLASDEQGGLGLPAPAAALGPLEQRAQIAAPHIFHDDEVIGAGRDQIDRVDDVGVIKRGRQPGLAQEQIDELGLLGVLGQKLLEHHLLLEATHPELFAQVNRPHSTLRQILKDYIAIEWSLEN